MTFAELNLNSILQNTLQTFGFTSPTIIQRKSFPVIMSGRDIVGIAQTGTGKTLAYVLPILNLIKFVKHRHSQVLVVVPTRELSVQVAEVFTKFSINLNIVTKAVYGGTNIKTQAMELADGADILVGTPGRLIDLIYHGTLNPKYIKKLVIDEVDEMLNLGFKKQIDVLFEMLPQKKQNILFSATMTEDVQVIIDEEFDVPQVVEAAPSGTPLETIRQELYHVPNVNTKINLLFNILNTHKEKTLLFVSTKSLADLIFERVKEHSDIPCGVIHSNKDQNFRFNAVNAFKNGTTKVLIATDIVARGIDIEDVECVINFDVPEEAEQYIHRIGRTGRKGKYGQSITFVSPSEESALDEIEQLMQMKVPTVDMPSEVMISSELLEMEMPRVHMKNQLAPIAISTEESAFHQKKRKNTKTNKRLSKAEQMKLKYKKPKTRGQKK